MRALKEGRSFSTNGPIIEFKLNGISGPGSRTTLQPRQTAVIEGLVRSRKALEGVG